MALFDAGSPRIPAGAGATSRTTTTACRSEHIDVFAALDTRPPETVAESNLLTPVSYLRSRQRLTIIELSGMVGIRVARRRADPKALGRAPYHEPRGQKLSLNSQ
jgi:hypothetical protein